MRHLTILPVLSVLLAVAMPAHAARGSFNVKTNFGALCDGVTNDRVAIQNGLNAASDYSEIVFPAADCLISGGALTITKPLSIRGTGVSSAVVQASANQSIFVVSAAVPVEFRDVVLIYQSQGTAGACIWVSPGAGTQVGLVVNGVKMYFCNEAVHTERSAEFLLTNFLIYEPRGVAVQVRNLTNPDHGDSTIDSGMILGGTYAVFVLSSGGLKINNTKSLVQKNAGLLVYAETNLTGLLVVSGNSFENFGGHGIQLAATASGNSYRMVAITGNQFGVYESGALAGIIIDHSNISDVAITGNVFLFSGFAGQYGVLAQNGNTVSIVGNVYEGNPPASGTAIGVGPGMGAVKVGGNVYKAISVPISVSNVQTVFADPGHAATFAALSAQFAGAANGSTFHCSDCRGAADGGYVAGATCAAGGSGALGRKVAGAWRCW